jgi:hypothetical protein
MALRKMLATVRVLPDYFIRSSNCLVIYNPGFGSVSQISHVNDKEDHMNRDFRLMQVTLCATLLAAMCEQGLAAILCVNPGGPKGCYSKIAAAVAAASPGDTINVAAGRSVPSSGGRQPFSTRLSS